MSQELITGRLPVALPKTCSPTLSLSQLKPPAEAGAIVVTDRQPVTALANSEQTGRGSRSMLTLCEGEPPSGDFRGRFPADCPRRHSSCRPETDEPLYLVCANQSRGRWSKSCKLTNDSGT
jgi:hypothetical protein